MEIHFLQFLAAGMLWGGAGSAPPGSHFGVDGEHPGVPGLLAGKALMCWNVGWEGWIFQLLHGSGRENCWREMGIITFQPKSGCMDL